MVLKKKGMQLFDFWQAKISTWGYVGPSIVFHLNISIIAPDLPPPFHFPKVTGFAFLYNQPLYSVFGTSIKSDVELRIGIGKWSFYLDLFELSRLGSTRSSFQDFFNKRWGRGAMIINLTKSYSKRFWDE